MTTRMLTAVLTNQCVRLQVSSEKGEVKLGIPVAVSSLLYTAGYPISYGPVLVAAMLPTAVVIWNPHIGEVPSDSCICLCPHVLRRQLIPAFSMDIDGSTRCERRHQILKLYGKPLRTDRRTEVLQWRSRHTRRGQTERRIRLSVQGKALHAVRLHVPVEDGA